MCFGMDVGYVYVFGSDKLVVLEIFGVVGVGLYSEVEYFELLSIVLCLYLMVVLICNLFVDQY